MIKRVEAEITRQRTLWGIQHHSKTEWLAILMEDVGQSAKAALEGDIEGFID